MPARDIYHDAVRNALIKDGWTITDDPLHMKWGKMAETKPEHTLFLAVPQYVVEDLFQEPIGQLLLQKQTVRVIGFDPTEETVTAWIP